jgi:hypothetical protein
MPLAYGGVDYIDSRRLLSPFRTSEVPVTRLYVRVINCAADAIHATGAERITAVVSKMPHYDPMARCLFRSVTQIKLQIPTEATAL